VKRSAKSTTKPAAKTKAASGAKTFRATLERLRSNLGWTIVFVPFAIPESWKVRGRAKVKGEINGFAFRTSLFPMSDGRQFVLVNKKMQRGAGVTLGSTAEFRLEPDSTERVATMPSELRKVLSEDRALVRWHSQLSYSMRKWISDMVTQPRSADARQRRATLAAEWLMSTMEAEIELPPMIKLAFTREPNAMKGWQLMTLHRRRGNLLAVFYYRSPEARERRLEKVIQEAVAVAERASKKNSD